MKRGRKWQTTTILLTPQEEAALLSMKKRLIWFSNDDFLVEAMCVFSSRVSLSLSFPHFDSSSKVRETGDLNLLMKKHAFLTQNWFLSLLIFVTPSPQKCTWLSSENPWLCLLKMKGFLDWRTVYSNEFVSLFLLRNKHTRQSRDKLMSQGMKQQHFLVVRSVLLSRRLLYSIRFRRSKSEK
jgi:hypothetical protein